MASGYRPLLYGGLTIALLVALWMPTQGQQKAPTSTSTTRKRAKPKSPDAAWQIPDSVLAVHFEKPASKTRDIFRPLFYIPKSAEETDVDAMMKIPSSFTDGDAN